MGDVAIKVQGLSKTYRIGATRDRLYPLRDLMATAVSRIYDAVSSSLSFSRTHDGDGKDTIVSVGHKHTSRDQWLQVLKGVSFEVKRGEVFSIIGRNGEGKSTILKILSRVTEPTDGYAEIYGRVGSLLEVGTGFHPELTGRENVYLNGAILGMKKAEVARKFERIIDFSEIAKFLDTPVKYYSSGMYVRLAFAVSAHLEPDVLIVDEVLAVGDGAFQRKCLGKVESLKQDGHTVVFVSHDLNAVRSISDRVMWIRNGNIERLGKPEETTKLYEDYLRSFEKPAGR